MFNLFKFVQKRRKLWFYERLACTVLMTGKLFLPASSLSISYHVYRRVVLILTLCKKVNSIPKMSNYYIGTRNDNTISALEKKVQGLDLQQQIVLGNIYCSWPLFQHSILN